jgi:hypothetical protein
MSGFDDYLNASPQAGGAQSFGAYLGAPAPAANPGQAAPVAAATAPQQPWKVPGGFGMGLGETVGGGMQSLVHGVAAVAQKYPNAAKALNFLTGGDLNADVAGDFANGAKQVDATLAQHDKAYAATRSPNAGVDWARLGGNLAGAAPLSLLAPETQGVGLLGRAIVGSGMGGLSSLLTPVTDDSKPYADQKQTQGLIGAFTGGAAAPVTAGVGRVVQGVTDPVRQRLAQAGVTMTPGQILGGAWKATEDKLSSVPVLGDFIRNAQQRSVQSFNRATYNDALGQIGETLPGNVGAGSDGVAYVNRQIGNVYNSLVPRARFVADQNFGADLTAIRNDLAQNAPGALPQFDNIVQNQITGKLNNGALTGEQWNNTRSTITSIARNRLAGNSTPDDRVLADALGDLGDAINSGVGRASPPDVLHDLGRANAAWSRYKQIEKAAGSVGASNNGNVFTSPQYASGVRNGATASQKATNSGLSGQLAADATEVLGRNYPDSGTVGRSLMTAGLGAAAGHAIAPQVMVPAATAIGVGSLPYTALGQRLTQGLLMDRPGLAAPVGRAISAFGPTLGFTVAPALAQSKP